MFREIEGKSRAVLAVPCPEPPSPSVCYSADLSLRYLPDLLSLAKGIASDDPLVHGLHAICRSWPLSSVGVPDVGELDTGAFLSHPTLRRLYVDRIIEPRRRFPPGRPRRPRGGPAKPSVTFPTSLLSFSRPDLEGEP